MTAKSLMSIKDLGVGLNDGGGMTASPAALATAPSDHAGAPHEAPSLPGLRRLMDVTRAAHGLHRSTALLLVDAMAAIGFAAGLAGAVATIASGGPGRRFAEWAALAFFSASVRGVAAMAAMRVGSEVAARAKTRLRRDLVGVALATDRSSLANAGTGGVLMALVVDEVEAVDAYLSRFVPARRAATFAPLMVLVAAAVASPVAAVILAATLLPFVVLMVLVGSASAAESGRQFAALARLSGLFVDRLRALPVVLAFGAEARETDRLAGAARDVASRTLRVLRLAFLSSAVLEFFSALCVALVAVYAGFQLLGLMPFHVPETLDLARAFFVLALAPEFYAPMRRLAAAYHDRQSAQTAADRIAAFEGDAVMPAPRSHVDGVAAPGSRAEHVEPHVDLHGESRTGSHVEIEQAPRIRFDRVAIRYAGSGSFAVSNLSFEVAAGRTVALLGPSGSGKTSVLRLLLGDAPCAAGDVWIDDCSLSSIDAGNGLASQACWVGQSPLIVTGTLRDNLRLVAPDAGDDALAHAMAEAGLGGLLERRDRGLDTWIDSRGGGLSGGERRRIALARALLKPSFVWLLDEPTAHLDSASETALIASIARASRGRTTVIATHSERLAAIADHVVRLGAGA